MRRERRFVVASAVAGMRRRRSRRRSKATVGAALRSLVFGVVEGMSPNRTRGIRLDENSVNSAVLSPKEASRTHLGVHPEVTVMAVRKAVASAPKEKCLAFARQPTRQLLLTGSLYRRQQIGNLRLVVLFDPARRERTRVVSRHDARRRVGEVPAAEVVERE